MLNRDVFDVSLVLILKQAHVVPDGDHSAAALPHIEHPVVVLRLDALLLQPVLSEVALILKVWRLLLEQSQEGLDEVLQQF